MSTADTTSAAPPRPAPPRPGPRRRGIQVAAALLVALGVGGALVHVADGPRRTVVMTLTPVPVAALKDGAAALKGQVADVFGDKFVVSDETGRALVETGPAARGSTLVTSGETVTVQGRFDHGSLHAAVLSHADGRQDALDAGPPGPPPAHETPWARAGF